MADLKITGVVPPVVVPDTPDHELDVPSFERLIDRIIDAGVDGLFFLGSSGEVVFSTDERRRQIISEAVRIVDHRVPVLVGIIDTETERVIEHGKVAQELGADALVATAPFYALGGMAEVEEHFRILHEELDLPIFAYDIPVCVHTKLPWPLLVKLGKEGVLAGVKDSSGDDISFRYLCQENEKAGHPALAAHRVTRSWSTARTSPAPTAPSRALPTSSPKATSACGRPRRAGDWGHGQGRAGPSERDLPHLRRHLRRAGLCRRRGAPSRPRSGSSVSLTPQHHAAPGQGPRGRQRRGHQEGPRGHRASRGLGGRAMSQTIVAVDIGGTKIACGLVTPRWRRARDLQGREGPPRMP